MKPTTGSGGSKLVQQGQTASDKHAANPNMQRKGSAAPRELNLKTKSE